MKLLLGQFANNGDCLYATILARQIKHDYPDAHLTWAISSLCAQAIKNNPYIDEILEVQVSDTTQQRIAWDNFEQEVMRWQSGDRCYDYVINSQIWPNNFRHFDGTIRPSILRAYGKPITVAIDNDIYLDDEELTNANNFIKKHSIDAYQHNILFECASKSGQSYVTPEFALKVANQVVNELSDACVILSSHQPIETDNKRIIDGSVLTLRENAELTQHCSQFVGCGSGLTVVATSGISRQLPNIQLLKENTSVYASFFHDFDYWGKSSSHFTEMTDVDESHVAAAIVTTCLEGQTVCREKYHKPSRLSFGFYSELIDEWLIRSQKYIDAARSILLTSERYGWHPELLKFAKGSVAPIVRLDPTCRFKQVSEEVEIFLDTVYSVR
jgi:hypothetical protein